MLIVNNTLPKCGGVWIHSMICRMVHYVTPDEKWRQPGWDSTSPSEADLPAFLQSADWSDRNILFKSHYSRGAIKLFDNLPGVRIIIGTRDPADAALSRYHHLVREGLTMDRDEWLSEHGVAFAANLRALEAAWGDSALIIRYERLLETPHEEISRMMDYLGIKPLRQTTEFISEDVSADRMRGRIGGHVRRASAGGAREDLPDDIYAVLAAA